MKRIVILYILAIPSLFFLAACNRYLEVEPKGVQLLATTDDYHLWLNNSLLEGSLDREINLLGDNVDNLTIATPQVTVNDLVYTWADQFNPSPDADPIIWRSHYRSISLFNTVLVGIDNATGPATQRASLKAEALLGRAFEYFYLLNLYGKPYDSATAATDIAIPFVTSDDVTEPTPSPSTVQALYNHVIADITTAIPNLPADNATNRYRGSRAAGYSVLARVYFYMRNYTEAARNAQLAIEAGGRELIDYNSMPTAAGIGVLGLRRDALYARVAAFFSTQELPALPFLRTFDRTDLRLKFFYSPANNNFTTRGQVRYNPGGVSFGSSYANWGTSIAEMRLIIAEAAARNNNVTVALQQLDIIRKRRFPSAAYQPYQLSDPQEVLQKVLDERSFELPFNGLRWFDMRRLDKEERMPAVTRLNAGGSVIATLAPKSPLYTLRIPVQTMFYNPDWPQNTR